MPRSLDTATTPNLISSIERDRDRDDPLTLALKPPPNETVEERLLREQNERESKRVSDEIDEMLKVEKGRLRRGLRGAKKPVKVLLLGQSESGKSTTIKNFQLTYSLSAWHAERASWRKVIQLNLIRSVNLILDLLVSEMTGFPMPEYLVHLIGVGVGVAVEGLGIDDSALTTTTTSTTTVTNGDGNGDHITKPKSEHSAPVETTTDKFDSKGKGKGKAIQLDESIENLHEHDAVEEDDLPEPYISRSRPSTSHSHSHSHNGLDDNGAGPSTFSSSSSSSSHSHSHQHSPPHTVPSLPNATNTNTNTNTNLTNGVGNGNQPGAQSPIHTYKFTNKHELIRRRLLPLRDVQRELEKILGEGSIEPTSIFFDSSEIGIGVGANDERDRFEDTNNGMDENTYAAAPFALTTTIPSSTSPANPRPKRHPQEFFVRSAIGWKSTFSPSASTHTDYPPTSHKSKHPNTHPHFYAKSEKEIETESKLTSIFASCKDDMVLLWEDPIIKDLLGKNGIRLEEAPGFFLNDINRVALTNYTPSDDDVIRARLRTVGVQEYKFVLDKADADVGHEWIMYDVGGTRTLRQAWSSYFDDVNAIIFLAPISCFNEKLAEDRRVNRLEDSFLLWKAVNSNILLKRVQLILFLNKCDLLDRKLRKGIKVREFVPSFGDRRNDTGTVAKYLRQKFRDMSKQYSPDPRPFYCHLTSVIDTKATAITLSAVREGILREHLRDADFI